MLKIRQDQYERLATIAQSKFEADAREFLAESWPDEVAEMGDSGVDRSIRIGLDQCRSSGLDDEYIVLRYLNIMYALGQDFASSDEYSWAAEILEDRSLDADSKLDLLEMETAKSLGLEENDQGF